LQRILLRHLLSLTLLVFAAAGIAACGGGGGDDSGGGGSAASSDTDVNTLLTKTFTGKKDISSGKIDLAVKVDISGGSSGVSGPFEVSLSGPFQTQGKSKLPKLDLDLQAKGQGQDIKAGLESTGDKGFVAFNGQEYAVPDNVFQQFKQGFEQAAAKGTNQSSNQSLTSLGIDPRKWLKDPKNAGEEKVGDTDVIKITGGVDVAKLLDDVNTALGKAGSLGLSNQQVPTRLTEEQKQQVEKALKDVSVEIYTGKDDTILRRMVVDLNAEDPSGSDGKITLHFDLQLLDLNEDQEFKEPSSTKPLNDLLQQFGGLGGLGGVLGGTGSSSSASGSSSGSGSAADSQKKLKKYSDCLEAAGQDVSKAQKCASILG
jgi:hypothetical protein